MNVLKAIVDLINTSPDHQAWLDEHPDTFTEADGTVIALPGFGGANPAIHIIGPVVDDWRPEEIKIEGVMLKIGSHEFDLNDPKSIDQVEELFGCNAEANPTFNPIDAIGGMIEDPPC